MAEIVLIPQSALKAKGITFSKPHLWRLERAGKFPKRVPISTNRYAYVESEIDAFLASRIAARDAGATMPSRKSAMNPKARSAAAGA